jgi:tRNA/tmRNA/rRNA uracil-C5-methylase (TrmA/RlmC/RlmD family)
VSEGGYRIRSLQAFDLFPQTAHVETVATFDLSA